MIVINKLGLLVYLVFIRIGLIIRFLQQIVVPLYFSFDQIAVDVAQMFYLLLGQMELFRKNLKLAEIKDKNT